MTDQPGKSSSEGSGGASTELSQPISASILQAIEDGQRLISYIAKGGTTELPIDLAKSMINAKYKAASGQWSAEEETEFLANYDKLATIVYPVTVQSLNAIIPEQTSAQSESTKAEQVVTWYRRYTLTALAVLLMAQFYWLGGNNLRVNLTDIFNQREAIHDTINSGKESPAAVAQLEDKLLLVNQKLDANYQLLRSWNRVSSFGISYSGELPEYTKEKLGYKDAHPSTGQEMTASEVFVKKDAQTAELDRDLYSARILYFKNILAANFFLDAFQGYILPLLYGLLGAFIYVLRSLLKDIRQLTYTSDNEIRYRLRLTLGSLGGMVVGWFLKPQGVDTMATLSPMALAFLMGYNVDVLFSLMDKLVDNIRNAINKPAEQPAPTAGKKE